MTHTHDVSQAWDLPRSIGISAMIVGLISFAAGCFFSSGNLGPLLGIFVTGPVGVLVGALWGCVRYAKRKAGPWESALWEWVVRIWMVTLLCTWLFWVDGVTDVVILSGLAVQVLILCASAFLLYHRGMSIWQPRMVRKCGPIVLVMMALILLMTLFPPVTRPPWEPVDSSASASLPMVAFILSPHFDTSQQFPHFVVNMPLLAFEWFAVLLGGTLGCILIARRLKSGSSPQIAEEMK